VSRETQDAFEELLGESVGRPGNRPTDAEAEREAAGLFALAEHLGTLRSVTAPASLRQTGLHRALATPVPKRRALFPEPHFAWRNWTFVASRAVAAMLAVVLFGYGTVASSAASLPNSPLYPVKLFVEDVQVAVSPPSERPKLRTEQAVQHDDQARKLADNGQLVEARQANNDAGKRLDDARVAANQVPDPQVQAVIEKTSATHDAVTRVLDDRQATPSNTVAQGPSGANAAATAPSTARPSVQGTTTSAPSPTGTPIPQNIGAPVATGGFTTIGAADASPTTSSSTGSASTVEPTAAAETATPVPVGAPSSASVVPIPTGRSATSTPAATSRPAASATPTTGSPTATATGVPQQIGSTGTPAPTSTPGPSATPSPTLTPSVTPTAGVSAPSLGFTPITGLSQPTGNAR
jgi:hypothetical protein